MDRTSWIAIFACIGLMFGWTYWSGNRYAPPIVQPVAAKTSPQNQPTGVPSIPTLSAANPAQVPSSFQIPPNLAPATVQVLENEYVRVTFTSYGGAIQQVELLKHKVDETHNVTLNQNQNEPILNLTGWDGDSLLNNYELVPTPPGENATVTFHRKLLNGGELTRTYQLASKYQVTLTQTINNPGTAPLTLAPYRLTVGVATPIYRLDPANSISAAWMVKDGSCEFHAATEFEALNPLGFHWRDARSVIDSKMVDLTWVAVKNQFFTTILTPSTDSPAKEGIAERIDVTKFDDSPTVPHGIKTFAAFESLTVPPQSSVVQHLDLYAGPKEYDQLKTLKEGQDAILDFGSLIGPVVKILLTAMNYVHRGIPSSPWHWNINYGWVVIIVTLLIKGMLWPLQSAANRSMKSMQVLQPRIKELQEKHKDEPQKVQTELMKLYKDYGVNPIGGCLPMVFQIPILIAFYRMLQNAIELRHVSWLWVHDLSQPDTIFTIHGIPFNPLPISMTLTQWLLMKMTPTAQDNQQMKVMQWMPFIFLFMLYNFAAALSLYWTVNNLVTMVQTYRNLKKPLPKLDRKKKARINPFGKK